MDASKAARVLVPQRFERRRCDSRGAPRPIRACAWRWRSSAMRATCNAKAHARVPLSFRVESCRRAFRDDFSGNLNGHFFRCLSYGQSPSRPSRTSPNRNAGSRLERALPKSRTRASSARASSRFRHVRAEISLASRARDASEWIARARGVHPEHRPPSAEGTRRARERRESRVASEARARERPSGGWSILGRLPEVGRGGGRGATRRTEAFTKGTSDSLVLDVLLRAEAGGEGGGQGVQDASCPEAGPGAHGVGRSAVARVARQTKQTLLENRRAHARVQRHDLHHELRGRRR